MFSSAASSSSSPSSSSRRQPSNKTSTRSSSSKSATASASALAPKADPYYGHKQTATTAARYIQSLFACPEYAPATNSSKRPSLSEFIAYALHRTRLPPLVTTASLLLLSRLKARFPSAKGSSGHRLFLSSFMAASKSLCDDTYSNASWVIVGQDLFPIGELNKMEREFFSYLEWNCVTHVEELLSLERYLEIHFTAPVPPPSYIPTPSYISSAVSVNAAQLPPTAEYDAYPSPPCSPVSLSFTASSNNSSPSTIPSTPHSTYCLPSSIPEPTSIDDKHRSHVCLTSIRRS